MSPWELRLRVRAIRFKSPYGGVALLAAGCATATVGEDPGFLVPDGYAGAPAGGPTGAGSGGGSGTGPTAGVGGATARGGRGNTTASAGRGGSVGSGGRAEMNTGGRPTMFGGRVAGATSSGGRSTIAGGAGTSSSTGACPNPRMPATPGATNGNSGSFATTGEVCYFVEGSFNQWACSNLGGRTVTINGMPAMCGGALPAPIDGGYYFDFGASSDGTNYTSFYWYTS